MNLKKEQTESPQNKIKIRDKRNKIEVKNKK